MKIAALSASLLAFTMLAAPALAQDQPATGQTEQDQLVALLADTRPAAELSDDELRQRFTLLRSLMKKEDLSRDVKKQLQDMAKDIRREIASREQGGGQQQAQAEQPVQQEQQQAQVEQPPVPSEEPAAQQEDSSDLLRKKKRRAQQQAAEEQPVPEQPVAEAPVAEAPAVEAPVAEAPAVEVPAVEPPAVDAQVAEQPVVKKKRRAEQPVVEAPAAEQPVEAAPSLAEAPPAEEPVVVPKLDAPAAAIEKKQVQALDGNKANPEFEAKATAYLNDGTDVNGMSDDDLRARLEAMRGLMEGNQLSRDTERALRKKLRAERNVLRDRVARAEAKMEMEKAQAEQPAANGKGNKEGKGSNTNVDINVVVAPPQVVLRDRRAPDDLEDRELRRRIEVLRDNSLRAEVDEDQRAMWRKGVERDRRVLRDRLITDKRRRSEELRSARRNNEINIELGIEFDPGRPPPPEYVFAAEVDDEELEDILTAPPRRKLERRYTIEEVEDSEDLRDAVPRIEVDTVRFGFGEAFVREEEIENLDRIAAVIERILAAHPGERIMVEGHTDAVGSNAANLTLSRQRAAAVKKALVTYYVIPAANLVTVGYGERYLKIPTSEPEQENRRVSIARATALLGEVEVGAVDQQDFEEQ